MNKMHSRCYQVSHMVKRHLFPCERSVQGQDHCDHYSTMFNAVFNTAVAFGISRKTKRVCQFWIIIRCVYTFSKRTSLCWCLILSVTCFKMDWCIRQSSHQPMKRNKEGGKNVRNGRGRTKAGWRSLHFDLQLFCNSLIPSEEPLELVGDSRSVTDVPGSSSIYQVSQFQITIGRMNASQKALSGLT